MRWAWGRCVADMRHLLALVLTCALPAGAFAAEMTFTRHSASIGYVAIKGDIEDWDLQRFNALLTEHPDARLVVLESPGGRLQPALEIGTIIRKRGMWTAAMGECASACAYIWMAGKPLVVSANTQLGFHSPYNGDGDPSISSVGNALVGAYLNQLGYAANVIAYATSADPKQMQWLTPRDAILLGLDVTYVTALPELLATLDGSVTVTTSNAPLAEPSPDLAAPQAPGESYTVPGTLTGTPADEKWLMAIYENVDFWGGDKYPKGLPMQSREECMATCAGDLQCKLFTYNTAYKSCFIKTKLDLVVLAKNLTSGMVYKPGNGAPERPAVRSDFRLIPGQAWIGPYMPIGQPAARSIDRCLRSCERDGDCEYLTFNSSARNQPACIVRRILAIGLKDERKATSFQRERKALTPSEILELDAFRPALAGPVMQ
jgi:hypothetical protein